MTYNHLCEFGCNQESTFQFKNGKHCCSKTTNGCPAVREKNRAANQIDLNWTQVQEDYDSGLSTRELAIKYGVSANVFAGASRRGVLVLRTRTDAIALSKTQGKGFTHHSEEAKAKIAQYAKDHHGGYRQGSGRGKKGWYNGIFCDSSWELAYLLFCEHNGVAVVRNTQKFKYVHDGKWMHYIPDFIVNGKFVEIKGYQTDQWESKKAQFPHDLEILTSTEMTHILEFVVGLYGKDFIKLYDGGTTQLVMGPVLKTVECE